MELELTPVKVVHVPACHVCKAQDETLRIITLPFVVSIIFVTFQRSFSGVYCRKHRRLYLVLASLITSIFGWLGIPFGFLFTPITLFQLARGGRINPKENFELQNRLANKKLLTGDVQGAIRCLEESLQFEDNPDVRQKLQKLYQTNLPQTTAGLPPSLKLFVTIVGIVLASISAGILTGILDMIPAFFLGAFFVSNDSIFIAILSWIPFVAAMFFNILWMRSLIGWVLKNNHMLSTLFVIAISFFASGLFFYSILETESLLRNIARLINAFSLAGSDGWFALRSLLLSGGITVLINNLKYNELAGLIFTILLLAGFGLCLYVGIRAGLHSQKWQMRLSEIRNSVAVREEDASPFWAWLPLGGISFTLVLFALLLYPGKFVNVEDAFYHAELGQGSMDTYKFDEALAEYKISSAIWQDSVMTHANLGLVYTAQDQYDQALAEFQAALEIDPNNMVAHFVAGLIQTYRGKIADAIEEMKIVVELNPQFGFAHATLANLYYQVDETELSEKEIQLALTYSEGDAQANSMIATYYFQNRELDKAERYELKAIQIGNQPNDYLYLARLYLYQNKIEQAEKAVNEAENLGTDPVDIYSARSNLAQYKGDLEGSEKVLLAALEEYPNNSDLLSDLSFTYFHLGRYDDAIRTAESAIKENPYNSIGYIELAFAYQKQGRLEEALTAAQKGAEFSSKYDRSHYILGLCYMESGMKEDAIREFELFLDLYIDRPYVREDKARVEEYLEQLR